MPIVKNKFITFGSFNNFNKINDESYKSLVKNIKKSEKFKINFKNFISCQFRSAMVEKFEKYDVINSVEFLSLKKILMII